MRLEGPAGPIVALDSRCEAKLGPGEIGRGDATGFRSCAPRRGVSGAMTLAGRNVP
jgi:hypothetical protein